MNLSPADASVSQIFLSVTLVATELLPSDKVNRSRYYHVILRDVVPSPVIKSQETLQVCWQKLVLCTFVLCQLAVYSDVLGDDLVTCFDN